jgi:hypothetical protein
MKVMQTVVLTLALLFVMHSGAATPTPAADINADPYVVLYQTRVDMAKAFVAQKESMYELERSRFSIAQRLYQSNAVSYEEYLTRKSAMQVEQAQCTFARLKLKEMEAILELVKTLRLAGKDVPLYPKD